MMTTCVHELLNYDNLILTNLSMFFLSAFIYNDDVYAISLSLLIVVWLNHRHMLLFCDDCFLFVHG